MVTELCDLFLSLMMVMGTDTCMLKVIPTVLAIFSSFSWRQYLTLNVVYTLQLTFNNTMTKRFKNAPKRDESSFYNRKE